jgi:hypothetical protein
MIGKTANNLQLNVFGIPLVKLLWQRNYAK